MSEKKAGDLVFTITGPAREQVKALLDDARDVQKMIVKLSQEVHAREEQAWEILREITGLDSNTRSYEFNRETGEVFDMGPSKFRWGH